MTADDIQSVGEALKVLENHGIRIRDLDVDFVDDGGFMSEFARAVGGSQSRTPVFTVELDVSALSGIDDYLTEPEPKAEGVQIRFDGEEPNLTFVEVEDLDGESIDIGEWVDDGEFRLLRLRATDV